MSKRLKYFTLFSLILFVLACNTVTQPFGPAEDLAETAQSLRTALPVETLQSIATQIATRVPEETFEALPSMIPSLEAIGSQMPEFENIFNPQGTPVTVWNEIPIMPQATAGEEFTSTKTYSYKVNAAVKEVQDYYTAELEKLGWTSFFNLPGDANGAVQVFQKEGSLLTITVAEVQGSVVVILTMA